MLFDFFNFGKIKNVFKVDSKANVDQKQEKLTYLKALWSQTELNFQTTDINKMLLCYIITTF